MSVGKQFGNIEYRCCTKYVVLANRCSKNFDIKNMSKVKPDTKQNDLPFLTWTDTWKFQRGEFQNVVKGGCVYYFVYLIRLLLTSLYRSYYWCYFNLQNIIQKKPSNITYTICFFFNIENLRIFLYEWPL